jgi:hypothetical protein
MKSAISVAVVAALAASTSFAAPTPSQGITDRSVFIGQRKEADITDSS